MRAALVLFYGGYFMRQRYQTPREVIKQIALQKRK
jgi:hypothetical protein